MSLRERRTALIETGSLKGTAFTAAYTAIADEWLTDLFDQALGGAVRDVTLIAVGGYGRGELCPYSDLDVVLVHRGRKDIAAIADQIWYPVWDEGVHLDHSVRRPSDIVAMANSDLRVALGLLDGRVVCGDDRVGEPVVADAVARWRRQRPPWLHEMAEQRAARHRAHGDLAFLLEPDLKEARGGLRDASALDALLVARPELTGVVDTAAVRTARDFLTLVRVELHRRAGRELNRLLLQEQDAIADTLGIESADELMRQVTEAAQTIAWETDLAWRRTERALELERRGRRHRHVHHGETDDPMVVVTDGEVDLPHHLRGVHDGLALRVGIQAAERELPIRREALARLDEHDRDPAAPWEPDQRALFVRLLAAGPPAIPAIETLERAGLFSRYLPEWAAVRNRPQRNAYHTYTVDRHLLEATALAATLAHRVSRPDLLLAGALLHDIGKGYPGDHTEVGMVLVADIGARMGFPPGDVAVLVNLVRLHLLLPDTATRRDINDPATAQRVAAEVGDRLTLDLLSALTEADSIATGPSAWGAWKSGLVAELVARTSTLLAGHPQEAPTTWVTDEHRAVMALARASASASAVITDGQVIVAAPDRPGLLACVTGVLALHDLNVRAADIATEGDLALERFTVEPARGRWPTAARLTDDLRDALEHRFDLAARLEERARLYQPGRPTAADSTPVQVHVDNNASERATVVEVRAPDRVGQLHRITQAVADFGADVVAARASTFGPSVVDAFYVCDASGGKILATARIRALEQSITEALSQA